MTELITNEIAIIAGPKGSGKTYFGSRMFGREDRALIYQPVRINTECDIFATHIFDGDMQGVCREMYRNDTFRIVYKVPDNDVVLKGKTLHYVSCTALATECYNHGDMTLYIDESQKVLNQETIDPYLSRVIELARNTRLNIVLMAQSLEIHRTIRRNADIYVLFNMYEPGDLDKVEERCGKAVRERVANLSTLKEVNGKVIPGEYFVWKARK